MDSYIWNSMNDAAIILFQHESITMVEMLEQKYIFQSSIIFEVKLRARSADETVNSYHHDQRTDSSEDNRMRSGEKVPWS